MRNMYILITFYFMSLHGSEGVCLGEGVEGRVPPLLGQGWSLAPPPGESP